MQDMKTAALGSASPADMSVSGGGTNIKGVAEEDPEDDSDLSTDEVLTQVASA